MEYDVSLKLCWGMAARPFRFRCDLLVQWKSYNYRTAPCVRIARILPYSILASLKLVYMASGKW